MRQDNPLIVNYQKLRKPEMLIPGTVQNDFGRFAPINFSQLNLEKS
jgi:hypothetical protein